MVDGSPLGVEVTGLSGDEVLWRVVVEVTADEDSVGFFGYEGKPAVREAVLWVRRDGLESRR